MPKWVCKWIKIKGLDPLLKWRQDKPNKENYHKEEENGEDSINKDGHKKGNTF